MLRKGSYNPDQVTRRRVIKAGLLAGAVLILGGDYAPEEEEILHMPSGPGRQHRRHHPPHGKPQPPASPPPPPATSPPVVTPAPGAAFFDDFTEAAGSLPDNANWVIAVAPSSESPSGDAANYTGSPSNVYVDGNSHLVIAVTAASGGQTVTPALGAYNSAQLATFDSMNGGNVKFAQSWGTFSASIKVSPAQGWWPAFWTTGTDITTWPECGEIDIMETFGPGGGSTDTAYSNVNGPMANGDNYGYGDDEQLATPATIETGFHTYTMVIPENYSEVTFSYDGIVYATVTQAAWQEKAGPGSVWPYGASTPQGIILDAGVGSNTDAAGVGYPAASQQLPAIVLEIDWVQATQP